MPLARLPQKSFVDWFRHSAPYIHRHRDRTFVVRFTGAMVASESFATLVHDVALLHSLGVKLVLVHGAAPQIDEQLAQRGATIEHAGGRPIIDPVALACVKEAIGTTRVEIEAMLSMGLEKSPMEGARLRVASGNFVTAKPIGVRDGVDHLHAGEVRRVDVEGLRARLAQDDVVLLSPLGYSVTGDVFLVRAEEVAREAAIALGADKLVFLVDGRVTDPRGRALHQLSPQRADELVRSTRRRLSQEVRTHLESASSAVKSGVRRAHLVPRKTDGALLLELFTRDGIGTMVTSEVYEGVRPARLDDVRGLVKILQPLEEEGILVRRPREKLETEIDRFTVVERDASIIGCAALYPFPEEHIAELACVAIDPDYRRTGRGDHLLEYMEERAKEARLKRLFVLTTHAAHWFMERGFLPADVDDLPVPRRALYNRQRKSKVFIKEL